MLHRNPLPFPKWNFLLIALLIALHTSELQTLDFQARRMVTIKRTGWYRPTVEDFNDHIILANRQDIQILIPITPSFPGKNPFIDYHWKSFMDMNLIEPCGEKELAGKIHSRRPDQSNFELYKETRDLESIRRIAPKQIILNMDSQIPRLWRQPSPTALAKSTLAFSESFQNVSSDSGYTSDGSGGLVQSMATTNTDRLTAEQQSQPAPAANDIADLNGPPQNVLKATAPTFRPVFKASVNNFVPAYQTSGTVMALVAQASIDVLALDSADFFALEAQDVKSFVPAIQASIQDYHEEYRPVPRVPHFKWTTQECKNWLEEAMHYYRDVLPEDARNIYNKRPAEGSKEWKELLERTVPLADPTRPPRHQYSEQSYLGLVPRGRVVVVGQADDISLECEYDTSGFQGNGYTLYSFTEERWIQWLGQEAGSEVKRILQNIRCIPHDIEVCYYLREPEYKVRTDEMEMPVRKFV